MEYLVISPVFITNNINVAKQFILCSLNLKPCKVNYYIQKMVVNLVIVVCIAVWGRLLNLV